MFLIFKYSNIQSNKFIHLDKMNQLAYLKSWIQISKFALTELLEAKTAYTSIFKSHLIL